MKRYKCFEGKARMTQHCENVFMTQRNNKHLTVNNIVNVVERSSCFSVNVQRRFASNSILNNNNN